MSSSVQRLETFEYDARIGVPGQYIALRIRKKVPGTEANWMTFFVSPETALVLGTKLIRYAEHIL